MPTHLAPDAFTKSAHSRALKNSAVNCGAKSWYSKFGG